MAYTTHEEHFATVSAEVRARLEAIQREVEACVSGATRCISYNMPAFKKEKTFFYFAGFKKHIGIYPPISGHEILIAETSKFRGPKGNLWFPHDQELPLALIGRVASALAVEYQQSKSTHRAGAA
jgi:uncharacterized protein YdhG (YjbR/CyaY superfamily)